MASHLWSFGPLQREILDILWDCPHGLIVRAVYRRIAPTRPVAYTTVMTTMSRLAERGILRQERHRATHHACGFVYTPILTRPALLHQITAQLWDDLGATADERRQLAEALHGEA